MGSPVVITDQDVLTLLDEDDEIATDVAAAFQSLGSAVPQAMAIAWANDLAQYQAWAASTRAAMSGGFFGGAWFGVPDAYNVAANWGATLKRHASDAANLGAKLPSLPDTPAPSTPATVSTPALGAVFGAEFALALAAIAVVVIVRKL